MKKVTYILLLIIGYTSHAFADSCDGPLNVTKKRLASEQQETLCKAYQNKVVLVVNTASKCGSTYQYEGLEQLYRDYQDKGLVVLGFPSNDFGGQEPGTEKQIQSFCRLTYGVQFPMYEKTQVARGTDDPLYSALAKASGEPPRWNFHKYLINRDGQVVGSFSNRVEPQSAQLIKAIEEQLQ